KAWLLSVITFVVTLVIVLAIFAVGRWAYDQMSKNDDTQTEVTEIKTENDDTSTETELQESQEMQQVDSEPTTTSPVAEPISVPETGPETRDLPRTGPDLDL